MEWVTIVALVAVLEYMFFGVQVGRARGLYKVEAPATTGNEMFERAFRIHQNTLEQLIVFLPALWLFANYVNNRLAALLGLVFIVARVLYARGYVADPKQRETGALVTVVAVAALLLGGLLGALVHLFR